MEIRHMNCPICHGYNTTFNYIAPPDQRGHRIITEVHSCNDCNKQFKVDYDLNKCAPISVYQIV